MLTPTLSGQGSEVIWIGCLAPSDNGYNLAVTAQVSYEGGSSGGSGRTRSPGATPAIQGPSEMMIAAFGHMSAAC